MSPKEYLHFLITSLVDQPEKCTIQETHDELGVLLTLSLAPTDMGMIIGRGGKTIDAIRTLLRIYGTKNNVRIHLRLLEEQKTTENP